MNKTASVIRLTTIWHFYQKGSVGALADKKSFPIKQKKRPWPHHYRIQKKNFDFKSFVALKPMSITRTRFESQLMNVADVSETCNCIPIRIPIVSKLIYLKKCQWNCVFKQKIVAETEKRLEMLTLFSNEFDLQNPHKRLPFH